MLRCPQRRRAQFAARAARAAACAARRRLARPGRERPALSRPSHPLSQPPPEAELVLHLGAAGAGAPAAPRAAVQRAPRARARAAAPLLPRRRRAAVRADPRGRRRLERGRRGRRGGGGGRGGGGRGGRGARAPPRVHPAAHRALGRVPLVRVPGMGGRHHRRSEGAPQPVLPRCDCQRAPSRFSLPTALQTPLRAYPLAARPPPITCRPPSHLPPCFLSFPLQCARRVSRRGAATSRARSRAPPAPGCSATAACST